MALSKLICCWMLPQLFHPKGVPCFHSGAGAIRALARAYSSIPVRQSSKIPTITFGDFTVFPFSLPCCKVSRVNALVTPPKHSTPFTLPA